MATKFKKKSAITRLVLEISPRFLRPTRGFEDQVIQWCQSNFKRTDNGCHSNEIWYKMGYNSACVKNITQMFAPSREFSQSCYWMMSEKFYNEWFPLPTKFQTKAVITRLVWQISLRSLHLTGVFLCQAIKQCQSNFTTTDPGCYGNEICDKIGYSACIGNIAETLARNRVFWAIEWRQINSATTDPGCHGDKI